MANQTKQQAYQKIIAFLRNSGANMEALGFAEKTPVQEKCTPMEIDQDPEEKVYELDNKTDEKKDEKTDEKENKMDVTPTRIDRYDPAQIRIDEFLRQMARYKHTSLEHKDTAGTLFATRKSNSRCVTLWINGVKRRTLLPKAPRCGHKTNQGRTCKRHTWESACCQHRQQ